MKVSFSVDQQGFKELDEALGNLKKATARGVMRRTLQKAAEPIIEEAQRLAPHRRGRLRRSIIASKNVKVVDRASAQAYAEVMRSGGTTRQATAALRDVRRSEALGLGFEILSIGPSTDAPHGHLQEFGTQHHAPQPYMRPAFDSRWRAALDIIKTELRVEIDKAIDRATRRAERMHRQFKGR